MAGVERPTGAAVRISPHDNVATLISPVDAGGRVAVHMMSGSAAAPDEVVARQPIDAGHKIALVDLPANANVLKYGLPIARASAAIGRGDHVHVHNAVSTISSGGAGSVQAAAAAHVDDERLRSAVRNGLCGAGVNDAAACNVADHIVEAHLRGVETMACAASCPISHAFAQAASTPGPIRALRPAARLCGWTDAMRSAITWRLPLPTRSQTSRASTGSLRGWCATAIISASPATMPPGSRHAEWPPW
jgi:hypothetical protein